MKTINQGQNLKKNLGGRTRMIVDYLQPNVPCPVPSRVTVFSQEIVGRKHLNAITTSQLMRICVGMYLMNNICILSYSKIKVSASHPKIAPSDPQPDLSFSSLKDPLRLPSSPYF